MMREVYGEQLPITIVRNNMSFGREEWQSLRESVEQEDWELLGFSLDPAALILKALPPACNMCRPSIDAKIDTLSSFLFERVATVAKATERIMEDPYCVHIG